MVVFLILDKQEWYDNYHLKEYCPKDFDGKIRCYLKDEIMNIMKRYEFMFKDRVVLCIQVELLDCDYGYNNKKIYLNGKLNIDAVVDVFDVVYYNSSVMISNRMFKYV